MFAVANRAVRSERARPEKVSRSHHSSPRFALRRLRLAHGQSFIELALILPILLVFVFGIIEFSQAWRIHQLITNTAREAARLAVKGAVQDGTVTQSDVSALVTEVLTGSGLDPNKATVTFNAGSGTCDNPVTCAGVPEEVRIQYPYEFTYFGGVIALMCAFAGCDATSYSIVQIRTTVTMRGQ